LFLGNYLPFIERFASPQIQLGLIKSGFCGLGRCLRSLCSPVFAAGFVFSYSHAGLGLGNLYLVINRIQFHQQIALFNVLIVFHQHTFDRAGHFGGNGHGFGFDKGVVGFNAGFALDPPAYAESGADQSRYQQDDQGTAFFAVAIILFF